MKLIAFAAFAAVTLSMAPATAQDPAQDPAHAPALDPDAAGPAERIWCADVQEQQQAWFRRRLALPNGVSRARLVLTCDNEAVVYVNGKEVARSQDWQEVAVVDVEDLVADNVVAIAAANTGGPAALACWILWTDAEGERRELVSDAQWRVSTVEQEGWLTSKFDDTAWQAAVPNFTTTFAQNVHNGDPVRVRFHSGFAAAADAIEDGVNAMRAARDATAALQALDAIERAVMAARRQIAAERRKPGDGTAKPSPSKR